MRLGGWGNGEFGCQSLAVGPNWAGIMREQRSYVCRHHHACTLLAFRHLGCSTVRVAYVLRSGVGGAWCSLPLLPARTLDFRSNARRMRSSGVTSTAGDVRAPCMAAKVPEPEGSSARTPCNSVRAVG